MPRPLLVVLLPLVAGRYIGEDRIARAVARGRGPAFGGRAQSAVLLRRASGRPGAAWRPPDR